MTQIIRIEHPGDGIGIWADRHYNAFSFYPEMEDLHDSFPNPIQEGYNLGEDEYCATISVAQFQKWLLPEWMDELIHKYGFKIYLLTMKTCVVLKHQVVYRKEDIISSTDISSLFCSPLDLYTRDTEEINIDL